MDDLTVTSQRSQVVDFSAPYETSTLEVMLQVCNTHYAVRTYYLLYFEQRKGLEVKLIELMIRLAETSKHEYNVYHNSIRIVTETVYNIVTQYACTATYVNS